MRPAKSSVNRLILIILTIVAVLGAALPALAQQGEWHVGDDDGRLNVDVHMGGLNVYCVDQWRQGAVTYEDGGGFQVLDNQSHEMLFVPEAIILRAYATMAATGQYVLLGESARGWYNGEPVRMYLLPNGEFQLNASDEYGKTVEFQWRECRNYTITTGDGCAPAWDRDRSGTCVHMNLY